MINNPLMQMRPQKIHQGEVKQLYAIVAYKQQGQEKLLIAKTPSGEVRCVSTEKSEIDRMYKAMKDATPRSITLVLTRFSLREDINVDFGNRL